MKILKASIENFRLLKSVDIRFSTSSKKNITVIRAANESGKTTLLAALQWGLFGDEGLPNKGRDFRLSPIDMTLGGEEEKIPISVEILFQIEENNNIAKYRVRRYVEESVIDGVYERGSSTVMLTRIETTGEEPVSYPEVKIRRILPLELREIFFTDGDRALSFIEGKRGDQMRRVKEAIKSLLGLDVIQDAQKHLKLVNTSLNNRIRAGAGNTADLAKVTRDISKLEEEIPELEKKLEDVSSQLLNLEEYEKEAESNLEEALKKGNKEELVQEAERIQIKWKRANEDVKKAAREHANLFKNILFGQLFLKKKFQKAKKLLDKLYDQGQIPNQTIPVLEERLKQTTCICGELITENDKDGKKRRENIKTLIEASRKSDIIQEKISALYYSAQELLQPVDVNLWSEKYKEIFNSKQRAIQHLRELGQEQRDIETKIEKLPDVDIKNIREKKNRFKEQARKKHAEEIKLSNLISTKERELSEYIEKRQRLLHKDEKGKKINSEIEVASDLEKILNGALETMRNREIEKVSSKMNSLFLEMIGADQSQRAVITKAEITKEFQIIVYGMHGHPLDPTEDLNGASRRALTLAFILALTNVSEVEAPNVIDTPLGMMSGYVKKSVLFHAAKESSQLILLLTHSEINNCENILDDKAGRVYTMTNPAHYPNILLNDPGISDSRILFCECNYREECKICERKDDTSNTEYFYNNEIGESK